MTDETWSLTCESNMRLPLLRLAERSFNRLLDPRGLCMYTSALTDTAATSAAATILDMAGMVRLVDVVGLWSMGLQSRREGTGMCRRLRRRAMNASRKLAVRRPGKAAANR